MRGVSKYFGKVVALDNLNFKISAGKTTVVIGPSGCGKTVLLKILVMLLRPTGGEVYFDDQKIDNLSENKLIEVRRRCGFLFQAGALFDSQTVAENVAFTLIQHTNYSDAAVQRLVREKLELVGMKGMEERMPAQLSGGQRKRIALARAIALSPEVILYDEPTTGLDPIRADSINELIIKLQHELNITSIVVTHDMHSANKVADRIVMLVNGRLIADGTPAEFRASADSRVQQFIQGHSEGITNTNFFEDENHV